MQVCALGVSHIRGCVQMFGCVSIFLGVSHVWVYFRCFKSVLVFLFTQSFVFKNEATFHVPSVNIFNTVDDS